MTAGRALPFLLQAERLSVARGSRTVLAGLSIAVRPGEIIGILGPNGAGKSTLLATLGGLIRPASGFVSLDGQPLADLGRHRLARQIAFLPQQRAVHWPLGVRATVALGRFPYRSDAEEVVRGPQAVSDALAVMDVAAIADRTVDTLSGGELARVLMARALAQDTPVLLADEPTAGLDPAHQLALFEALVRRAQAGSAILVAIHDIALAARFCTRLVLLKDGRLHADGSPDDVLSERLLADVYGIDARLITVDGARIVVPVTKSGRR